MDHSIVLIIWVDNSSVDPGRQEIIRQQFIELWFVLISLLAWLQTDWDIFTCNDISEPRNQNVNFLGFQILMIRQKLDRHAIILVFQIVPVILLRVQYVKIISINCIITKFRMKSLHHMLRIVSFYKSFLNRLHFFFVIIQRAFLCQKLFSFCFLWWEVFELLFLLHCGGLFKLI